MNNASFMEVVNFRDFTFSGEEGFLVTQHQQRQTRVSFFFLQHCSVLSFSLSFIFYYSLVLFTRKTKPAISEPENRRL